MIENRDLHSELSNVFVASNYSGYVSIEMSMTDDMCLLENAMKYVSEVFG